MMSEDENLLRNMRLRPLQFESSIEIVSPLYEKSAKENGVMPLAMVRDPLVVPVVRTFSPKWVTCTAWRYYEVTPMMTFVS